MLRIIYAQKKGGKKSKKASTGAKPYCPFCKSERGISYTKTLQSLEKSYNAQCGHLYGRSLEEGWAIKAAATRRLIWACDDCLESGKALAAKPWLQVPSIVGPYFAYSDRICTCADCGVEFLFSAEEQAYWYESLQFVRASYPKQCPKCRRNRRIYKRHFHDLQRALEALEPRDPIQLANVAQLYLKIDHPEKALEYFRRAKNQTKDESGKRLLEQQISAIVGLKGQ